jgi:hypothetical protein
MICGAEACNLSAMIHGAELRVHFLKSFQKRSTCENLSQKGLKSKKDGRLHASPSLCAAAIPTTVVVTCNGRELDLNYALELQSPPRLRRNPQRQHINFVEDLSRK